MPGLSFVVRLLEVGLGGLALLLVGSLLIVGIGLIVVAIIRVWVLFMKLGIDYTRETYRKIRGIK